MKQFIESGAVRIGAAIQSICANVDFEVLSLPGGSLIAVLLWLYAIGKDFIPRAVTQGRARMRLARQPLWHLSRYETSTVREASVGAERARNAIITPNTSIASKLATKRIAVKCGMRPMAESGTTA
jgi:hypothetical protein